MDPVDTQLRCGPWNGVLDFTGNQLWREGMTSMQNSTDDQNTFTAVSKPKHMARQLGDRSKGTWSSDRRKMSRHSTNVCSQLQSFFRAHLVIGGVEAMGVSPRPDPVSSRATQIYSCEGLSKDEILQPSDVHGTSLHVVRACWNRSTPHS